MQGSNEAWLRRSSPERRSAIAHSCSIGCAGRYASPPEMTSRGRRSTIFVALTLVIVAQCFIYVLYTVSSASSDNFRLLHQLVSRESTPASPGGTGNDCTNCSRAYVTTGCAITSASGKLINPENVVGWRVFLTLKFKAVALNCCFFYHVYYRHKIVRRCM